MANTLHLYKEGMASTTFLYGLKGCEQFQKCSVSSLSLQVSQKVPSGVMGCGAAVVINPSVSIIFTLFRFVIFELVLRNILEEITKKFFSSIHQTKQKKHSSLSHKCWQQHHRPVNADFHFSFSSLSIFKVTEKFSERIKKFSSIFLQLENQAWESKNTVSGLIMFSYIFHLAEWDKQQFKLLLTPLDTLFFLIIFFFLYPLLFIF